MRIKTILAFLLVFYCHNFYAQDFEDINSSYSISSCRYWFDTSMDVKTGSYNDGSVVLDLADIEEGFHTMHYQVLDSKGEVSPSRTISFFRVASAEEKFKDYAIKSVRYWFDKDFTPREVVYTSGTSAIDVADLEEGFHTMHYQVLDSKGEVSPSRTISFFRVASAEEKFKDYAIKSVRYWFDKDFTPREVAYTSGTSSIDVADLEEGFHTMHYQVLDSKGEVSPSRTISFFRVASAEEKFKDYAIKSVRYWFDKDFTPREVAYTSGTSAIDVADLEEGFHTMHYQVLDSKGEVSPSRTISFFRIAPVEEKFKDYAIKSVRYWFDQDESAVVTEDYMGGITALDLHRLSEGTHTMFYQVTTDDGTLSPVRNIQFVRYLYDIYVSTDTEYTDSIVTNDPLLSSKPDLKLHYKSDDVSVRGHLTIDNDARLSLGKFIQTGNLGYQNGSTKYTKAGADYYHPTTLVNNGFARADSVIIKQSMYRDRWHFVSFPFNAEVGNIDVPDGTYWALRKYDSEQRASGNMTDTWTNLHNGDTMQAGIGYIIQFTKEGSEKTSELTFKAINDTKKNDIFTSEDVDVTLNEYEAEFAHNRSWNFIGNPYPSFFDSHYIGAEGTITVWNGNGYSAYSLLDDNYILMPFEAFFIQKPLNAGKITFSKDGRQHNHVVREHPAQAKSAVNKMPNRRILDFTLRNDNNSDKSRVVINNIASRAYEVGRDASKFMEETPRSAQIYSVETGVKYAINERPMGDGIITFSVYIPEDGEYTLKLDQPSKDVLLKDIDNDIVTDLGTGEYVFTAKAGTYNARFVVSLNGEATDISQIATSDDGEIKVIGNILSFDFLKAKTIQVFGTDGRTMYNKKIASDRINLNSGIYIVNVNGAKTKVVVK
ncbi:MAG: T9SS type A sorting domain-containing protein [Prevotella sp.]|nr:T9SS type A sorting domain-containing protein [Candidatus Prevotella equi]